ncbi:hypothetical protein [Oceanibacterium hippocampi]|uniref:Uncharacterized protein n=1 Tax=Oceanibacterium hippocampi TaxID=745714 RepID=A0A1Y5RKJ6_9PROT|nr:hypothetical protein [Oceanibacterium hippocampi]SLN18715.1 hypothetical protein OCH7691_00408 [Oceanibacterium hippocampi]
MQIGRSTVEQSLVLRIDTLRRDRLLRPGLAWQGTLVWRRVPSGEETASVAYRAYMLDGEAKRLELRYAVNGESRFQSIPLEWTRPGFGGRRWWFICPVSGRRVSTLMLPPGGDLFAARQAWGLAYQSQRENAYDRAISRAQKIRMQLGGDPSLAAPFPLRPKGMHRRTYRRLMSMALAAEEWGMTGMMNWCQRRMGGHPL